MGAIAAKGLRRGANGYAAINKKLPTTGTPVCSVKGAVTLTIAEPVTAEDTMTIGSVVYTFKADGTAAAAGEIDMGADEAATKVNIPKAILGTDSINTAHPDVTCPTTFTGDGLVITAKAAGAHVIASTETFDHASNVFSAAALASGVEGTVADIGDVMIDDTYVYFCVALHDDGANWRRVALGSAY